MLSHLFIPLHNDRREAGFPTRKGQSRLLTDDQILLHQLSRVKKVTGFSDP
jgi:hypothetical protein